MDSSSLIEPPGWMMAVIPEAAAASTLSLKGKKASEAMTQPWMGFLAFMTPILAESTRLICPAPTPTSSVPLA